MKTRSVAVIGAGGVLRHVASRPPLTIRRIKLDDAEVCGLCLVGSAAGPLAGVDVTLELTVENHAQARVVAAGASIAQGRPGAAAGRLASEVTVGEHARLDAEPAPLICSAGSRTEVAVAITLAATGAVSWRELLVLGRTGEAAGALTLAWSVERAGQPLLAQTLALPTAPEWPGMLAGNRVLASALLVGPEVKARTIVHSPTAVCQPLADDAVLLTVLDTDAAQAEARLAALRLELTS